MTDIKEEIKEYDSKDVYGSTAYFIDQCRQIFDLVENYKVTQDTTDIKNMVFSGMGGSAYGGQVAQALLKNDLKIPTFINNDYSIPNFVDSSTLFIATSYSGTTEETISSAKAAMQKNAKVVTLSTGGDLAALAKENNYDAIVFDPVKNPSGQPRLGTGYIVFGTIEILRKFNLTAYSPKDIENAINEADKSKEHVKEEGSKIADKLFEKIPFIFAGDHLLGNAHIMRNQFNETAKNFASYHALPEADHHLLEGLQNPKNSNLKAFFLDSDLYTDRLKKRFELTRKVVEKNNKEYVNYKVTTQTKLAQVAEVLMLGSYITFFEAIKYRLDPSLIPWVDYFKEELGK